MPQVDLETLVSACAGSGAVDNKISCETLAAHADDDDYKSEPDLPENINPDFLPESFWLSKDAEFDWFDRNAFYVRSESTKGNANLNSNLIQNTDSHSNSGSQRFSGTLRRSKAAVIGLPKPQKFMDSKNRRNCKTAKPRLFPKRSGSGSVGGGKSNSQVIEPSSPNVSCMGRVRSKRDRNRRFRTTRQRSNSAEPAPPVKPPKPTRRKRDVLFSTFRAIFRHGKRSESASSHKAQSQRSDSSSSNRRNSMAMSRDIRERLPPRDMDEHSTESLSLPRRSVAESETAAIGLGGMKRFVSGRRPDLASGTGDM